MFDRNEVRKPLAFLAVIAACCAIASSATASHAASIPGWLDAGITRWNDANPTTPLKFMDIKDSYVWYEMPKSKEFALTQLRDRLNHAVLGKGYQPLDDEEMVTTARPPVAAGKAAAKKCWSRGFVLNIQAQNDTKALGDDNSGQRQRMLSSLVCDDTATWWAAFRVAD